MNVVLARPAERANPEVVTVAMVVSVELHVIGRLQIVSPVIARTTARNRAVSYWKMVVSAGEMATDAGVGMTRTGTSRNAPAPRTRIVVFPTLSCDGTKPRFVTVTINVSPELNSTATPVMRWPAASSAVTLSCEVELRLSKIESGVTTSVAPGPDDPLQPSAARTLDTKAVCSREVDRIGEVRHRST